MNENYATINGYRRNIAEVISTDFDRKMVNGEYKAIGIGIEFLDENGNYFYVKTWVDKLSVVVYNGQRFDGASYAEIIDNRSK